MCVGKVAFAFAGQGSHIARIGAYLPQDIKDAIVKKLGREFMDVLENGTEDEIKESRYAQVGIMAYTYALARHAIKSGLKPDVVLGHSLGEYTAALVGGLTDFETMLEVVYLRAEYMDRYAPEGFILVVFKPLEQVKAMLPLSPVELHLSNINAENQTLVGGHIADVDKAMAFFKDMGWKVRRLDAAAIPFHTPLMNSVRVKFAEVVDRIPGETLHTPLYSNALDEFVVDPVKVKLGLLDGIETPVNWVRAVRRLKEYGVDTLVEFAPKPVLSKLTKRIDKTIKIEVYEVKEVETKLE